MKHVLSKFIKEGIKKQVHFFVKPTIGTLQANFSKINYGLNVTALSNYNETI